MLEIWNIKLCNVPIKCLKFFRNFEMFARKAMTTQVIILQFFTKLFKKKYNSAQGFLKCY